MPSIEKMRDASKHYVVQPELHRVISGGTADFKIQQFASPILVAMQEIFLRPLVLVSTMAMVMDI